MLNNWKFHHVGYAGDNKEIIHLLKSLNYSLGQEIYDPIQNVYLKMCDLASHPSVEIISPKDKNSQLTSLGFYHVCYEVPSIDEAIIELNNHDIYYFIIQESKPALLFNNRNICFIKTKFGIIELLEAATLEFEML